jgi:hypothetical protein
MSDKKLIEELQRKQKLAESIGRLTIDSLKFFIKQQGHEGTGRLLESLRFELKNEGDVLSILFFMSDYGLVVDSGVSAQNIPFGGDSTGAETSDFIAGLEEFAIETLRVGSDEAINVAFAIATTMAETGMPTPGAFKFSKNGQRTEFIKQTLEEVRPQIVSLIVEAMRATSTYLLDTYKESIKYL